MIPYESQSYRFQLELLQLLKVEPCEDLPSLGVLSEVLQSTRRPQEANQAPTCSPSIVIENEVPILTSSSTLQFPAIPLWSGTQIILIIK